MHNSDHAMKLALVDDGRRSTSSRYTFIPAQRRRGGRRSTVLWREKKVRNNGIGRMGQQLLLRWAWLLLLLLLHGYPIKLRGVMRLYHRVARQVMVKEMLMGSFGGKTHKDSKRERISPRFSEETNLLSCHESLQILIHR